MPVVLPSDQAGEVLTVEHLANHVAAKTGVAASNQRLIFKGKLRLQWVVVEEIHNTDVQTVCL